MTTWHVLTRFLPFVKPHGLWMSLAIFCSLVNALLSVAFAYLIKNLIDTALNAQYDPFTKLIYLTLGLGIVGMTVRYLDTYASTRYSTHTIRDLRNRLTAHIQRSPLSYMEAHHMGDVVSRLNNDVRAIAGLMGSIPGHLYQPLLFICAFVYMLLINWKLLLATFVLIPFSAWIYDKISKPIEQHSRELREHIAEATSVTQDSINGVSIVKAFNLEDILSKKYKTIIEQVQTKGLRIDKINAYLAFVWLVLRFTPQLVCPIYGGYLIMQGELTVGGLLACLRLIWYIFYPTEAFLGLISEIREAKPAAERLVQILDQSTEREDIGELKIQRPAIPIEFVDVSFAYDAEKPLLNRLSFQLPKGQIVALVGPSGGGKSTIFKLLCGFYQPKRGLIRLYGVDIHQSNFSAVRAHLSLVSQDTYLFPTTIIENIAYGRQNATRDEVVAAAKAANAHEFIMELPQSYETPVGEWGGNLSGGECQRIALARAVLKDAPILLLDEPTSALDTQSEALITEALDRVMAGRTVFVIAHRLSTIEAANQVIVLDEGHIIEHGNHEALMGKDSLYRKLYLKQTLSVDPSREKGSEVEV